MAGGCGERTVGAKSKRKRQKANNVELWTSVVKEVKVLRRAYNQGVSK